MCVLFLRLAGSAFLSAKRLSGECGCRMHHLVTVARAARNTHCTSTCDKIWKKSDSSLFFQKVHFDPLMCTKTAVLSNDYECYLSRSRKGARRSVLVQALELIDIL